MRNTNPGNSTHVPRATHEPTSERLTPEELEDVVDRLTGEDDIEFREADSPFDADEDTTEKRSNPLDEL